MLTFPNAKINLGLNITEKRPDGYHNLETIFYPVPIEDALEINILNEGKGKFRLHQAGLEIEGEAENNLVVKAYKLLDDRFNLPPVDIHLFKHIPSGAGLGGGSADAAFMLKLLNNKFELGLPDDTLETYAAKLGADCAFFIRNRPTYAEGIGNIFSPLPLSLKGYRIWLVKPDIFVSTRDAFAKIKPHHPEMSLKEIAQLPVEEWNGRMVNDFEESVFPPISHYRRNQGRDVSARSCICLHEWFGVICLRIIQGRCRTAGSGFRRKSFCIQRPVH